MSCQIFRGYKPFSCSPSKVYQFGRAIYVAAATVLVSLSLYNVYEKMKDETVLVKEQIQDFEKMRYPSITFCYNYTYGSKDATVNYLPSLYEIAKNEGCLLNQLDVFAGDVAHHEDVSNASACMDLCQKNKECELWTLISGMCFLKNEKAYPKALPHTFKYNAASGHKNCSSDDCVLFDFDFYGGDLKLKLALEYKDCEVFCQNDPSCKKWTHARIKSRDCLLKKYLVGHAGYSSLNFCRQCVTGLKNTNNVRCSIEGPVDPVSHDYKSLMPTKTSFLRLFEQRFPGGAPALDVLNNNEYWNTFVANEYSGPCYTYNPPLESDPGKENNMYMVFNMTDWDPDLKIFLHHPKSFFYSTKEGLGSSSKLITSQKLNSTATRHPRAIVKLRTRKKISTNKVKCNDDENYDIFKCIENYYSEQRGCQYPWNVYNDSNTRVCANYSEIFSTELIRDRNKGFRRQNLAYSQHLLMTKHRCYPPCFQRQYEIELETWLNRKEEKDFVSLQIAFEDFIVTHIEEYRSCDISCIVGEVGGNLGFFLGGSVLMGLDIIYSIVRGIVSSITLSN